MLTTPTIFALALAAAPPGGGYTRDQLKVLATTALQEFSSMEARCAALASLTVPDLEAETAFRRSADFMEIVVKYEAYPPGGHNMRSDDVAIAVQALERAYMCHPGWEQRHYIDHAIVLLEDRLRYIRTTEKRPPTEPDVEILQQALTRVQALERSVPAAPVCLPPACPKPPVRPTPSPLAKPRGYQAKYMDLFSLRVELGGGIGTKIIDRDWGEPKPVHGSLRPVFSFSLAPGVRFLLGREQRHVLATGFRWTVLAFEHRFFRDSAQQMVARFEYGIRIHERWLSMHGAFEPGLQIHADIGYFGRPQMGGSAALCTGNEVLCVRFGGYKATRGKETALMDGMFLSAGVDVFRAADNLLRRADR